jgi:alcohol dehydrogenase
VNSIESKSLMLMSPRRLEWVVERLSGPGSREVVLKTVAGSISGGTELPQFLGTARHALPITYPRMTGYESVAIITDVGNEVENFRPGDRVVATYGHRTHAVVGSDHLIPIPQDVDDRTALLVILSGDVATGVGKLGTLINDPVLVTGSGAIGLLTIFVLRSLGTPAVDVVEPLYRRRQFATRLGSRACVAPADLASLDGEYASGIECSGRDAAFAILQAKIAERGRMCILSDGNIEPLTLSPWFHARQLCVVGSSDCQDYRHHADWYYSKARDASVPLSAVFEHEVPSSALPEVFEQLARGSLDAVKVFVRYDST